MGNIIAVGLIFALLGIGGTFFGAFVQAFWFVIVFTVVAVLVAAIFDL